MVLVPIAFEPLVRTATLSNIHCTTPVAIALSMIVEITSLDPALDLEVCGDARPQPARHHRDDDRDQDVEDSGTTPGRRTRHREGRHAVLAVDTDIEQIHPEADGDGDLER